MSHRPDRPRSGRAWDRFRAAGLATLVSVAAPARLDAHSVNTGFGPFYDGLVHLFLGPQDLLPVIALALLAGLGGPRDGRYVLVALPAAWSVGMMLGSLLAPSPGASWPAAISTLVLGALVAADRKVPLPVIVAIAVLLGLLVGFLNGSALASAGLPTLVGILCAVFMVAALIAGQVARWRASWTRVAVRVAGSWIAAIGLFMVGWAMKA